MSFVLYYLTDIKKIGRPKIHRYFGIHHKLDGIRNRLNLRHSILSTLKVDSSLDIWIGCFGDLRWHSDAKVEEVETFLPSMSVVNLWYDRHETPWIRKPKSACFIQDVMVWENDSQRLLTAAKLSKREE